MNAKAWRPLLWAAWIALAIIGGIGIVERLLTGHRFAAYTSYIPWGMWVAAYIYFIGLSAGAFLLSSLVYVFGVHNLDRDGEAFLGRSSLRTDAELRWKSGRLS
jgi:Ni/Fe-hydrogenase subunit HybB-like protein